MVGTANGMDTTVTVEAPAKPAFIAPLWHTVVLVAFLLAISWLGAQSQTLFPGFIAGHIRSRMGSYLVVIVMEWAMVVFVWYGVRIQKKPFKDLFGPHHLTFTGALRDLGIAVLFLIGSNIVLGIIAFLLRVHRNPAVARISPQTRAEVVMYLLLSLSAGICEEIVCRGYLQRQLTILFQNAWAAVVLQGIVFGAAHGYQGAKLMVIVGVYGCMFGTLALLRKSLYPGMMTHALQDGLAGLLVRHLAK
jgi:membrane protease YdiL (CAAX protease family)